MSTHDRGWTTSARLRQALIPYVYQELSNTHNSPGAYESEDAVDQAISAAFQKLDADIVWSSVKAVETCGSKVEASRLLSPAISGSCALLLFYDAHSRVLKTACTGDSRAVLGRRVDGGLWAATQLSSDQTGSNPAEADRLRIDHPDEDSVVSSGRVLGVLEVTRAFGDGAYKWNRDKSLSLRERFFARNPSPKTKALPYVTAEPTISTTIIQPERRDFVVMASDALWEMLSNEEVVGLVGQWLDQKSSPQKEGLSKQKGAWSWNLLHRPQSTQELPVMPSTTDLYGKPVDRPEQWQLDVSHRRFVFEDENAATHLARNAFGADNHDLMAGLLMQPQPNVRRFRDDLTITVIFFGQQQSSDSNVQNQSETLSLKARL